MTLDLIPSYVKNVPDNKKTPLMGAFLLSKIIFHILMKKTGVDRDLFVCIFHRISHFP